MREDRFVRSCGTVGAMILIGLLVVLSGGPLDARPEENVRFVRGDANSDGQHTLSDVYAVLRNNLLGDRVGCQDAADVDDNGKLDQIDAFYLVGALFFRHSLIAEPFAEPGPDPTPDDLDCESVAVKKVRGVGGTIDCEDPGGIADLEFIHFRNGIEVLAGQQHIRVPVVMNSPVGDVEGLTISFHAPPEAASLETIDVDGGVFDWFGVRPGWVIPYEAQRSDGFLALTVAMSLSPPFAVLPKFHDAEVAYLQFSVSPHLAPGSRFRIDFADIPGSRGSPPIRNELSRNGARQVYGVCSLSVSVVSEAELFVRGDANRDWRINMSDVVTILSGLFGGAGLHETGNRDAPFQTVFPCPDAADLDDDGHIQLNDAMYLALYLFKGGAAPLSPFPQPGRDSLVPEQDQIDCDGR